MKYVILIHSNPQPWGHPTSDHLAEYQHLSAAERDQLNKEFDAFLAELHAAGELVSGEALADPRSARLFRWDGGAPIVSDGPYAETKEQFAGYFVIDVRDQVRAEEVAARFAGPGETVELRPAMWPDGGEA
ncbi:MAG: hypothetical protein JNL54_04490 [Kineosporiaceae bacterium]|nr:hypothetical protein [Kineosporiaceae bacterium]